MILTGSEIINAHRKGELEIEPFSCEHVNPNSYNFRIGNKLRVYKTDVLDPKHFNEFEEIEIEEEGFILERNKLYLAHTVEKMGSNNYIPTFAARSSVARLGLMINLSANLGDIGFKGQWTLQLYATQRLVIYPGMLIGQIMWWKPKGEIDLYNGKYQGSNGPRVSEIYLDYNKNKKHILLPSLGSTFNNKVVGNKFRFLSELSSEYLVPKSFCVTTEFISEFMFSEEIKRKINSEMIDIKSTVGAFLKESAENINSIVMEASIKRFGVEMIYERLIETFGENFKEGIYAIRSSGTNEDGEKNSYAGIHDSYLNVQGKKDIIESIENVIKSYYSVNAIIHRVTNGDFTSNPEIAVIVQEMINPQMAGVAFCEKNNSDLVTSIESVNGTGDDLVSGLVEPHKEIVSKRDYLQNEVKSQKVCSLAFSIREQLGHDVDIEWCIFEEEIFLLQCRPITKNTINNEALMSKKFSYFNLYDSNPPKTFEFGDVSDIYISYTKKKIN